MGSSLKPQNPRNVKNVNIHTLFSHPEQNSNCSIYKFTSRPKQITKCCRCFGLIPIIHSKATCMRLKT